MYLAREALKKIDHVDVVQPAKGKFYFEDFGQAHEASLQ
jgi:hypothetical protein